jgi:hypothetical protein
MLCEFEAGYVWISVFEATCEQGFSYFLKMDNIILELFVHEMLLDGNSCLFSYFIDKEKFQ